MADNLLDIHPGSADVVTYVMGNSIPSDVFSDICSQYPNPPTEHCTGRFKEKKCALTSIYHLCLLYKSVLLHYIKQIEFRRDRCVTGKIDKTFRPALNAFPDISTFYMVQGYGVHFDEQHNIREVEKIKRASVVRGSWLGPNFRKQSSEKSIAWCSSCLVERKRRSC